MSTAAAAADPRFADAWADGRGRRSLLDLDPDLGALLDRPDLVAARHELTARVAVIGVGQWDLAQDAGVDRLNAGLLVVDGVLAREVALQDIVSTELLGPGEIARAWQPEGGGGLLPISIGWNALTPVRMALLDRRLVGRLARWPQVNAVLMERMHARTERLATIQAICQLNRVDDRVLALFVHLAERFGRISPEGVLVPLALSHRLIGQIVGARRPTVSTALATLADRHALLRRDNGTWLLPEACAAMAAPGRLDVIPQRRSLMPLAAATPEAGESPAA